MSARIGFPLALLLAVVTGSASRAQDAYNVTGADLTKVPAHAKPGEVPPPEGRTTPYLSDWINYTQPDCCKPAGCNGPISWELYLRNGASIPIGGGVFGDVLEAGWEVSGGGRALLYNTEQTKAWAIDLGINNIANRANSDPTQIPMTVLVPRPVNTSSTTANINTNAQGVPVDPQFFSQSTATPTATYPSSAAIPVNFGTDPRFPGLTLKSLNRSFVNLGFGREWWLNAPSNDCCWLWRAGVDGGGRWGVARANFEEIRHRTDTMTGMYAAVHSDIEVPIGCCKFQFGVRGEWDWTWMNNILMQNDANIQSINILASLGIRY